MTLVTCTFGSPVTVAPSLPKRRGLPISDEEFARRWSRMAAAEGNRPAPPPPCKPQAGQVGVPMPLRVARSTTQRIREHLAAHGPKTRNAMVVELRINSEKVKRAVNRLVMAGDIVWLGKAQAGTRLALRPGLAAGEGRG